MLKGPGVLVQGLRLLKVATKQVSLTTCLNLKNDDKIYVH